MTRKHKGPKIGTLDIETAPLDSQTWGTFKQMIGLNQIVREWTLLSFCSKWLHEKRVTYMDNRDQEDPRDDRHMLQALWDFLDEADIVVTQNGVKFDMRKIRARFIMEGFPPFSPVKQIDTLLESRKIAAFTSHKLEWMSDKLTDVPKSRHDKFPGYYLWKECMAGNIAAWNEMKKYNPIDVKATELVYLKIRPWIEGHPNVAQFYDDDTRRCPKCGSVHLVEHGVHYTQSGEYQRFRCGTCFGFSRDRYTTNSKSKRKSLLSN